MARWHAAHPPPRYVLVVGIDFSDVGWAALEDAMSIAERVEGAEVHLVNVVTSRIPPSDVAACVSRDLAQLNEIDQAMIELQRVLDSVRSRPVCVCGHVRVGRPDRELAQIAADLGADMIVVGTHDRHGLERWIVGSVADRLLRHARCEVLVHRPSSSGRAGNRARSPTYDEVPCTPSAHSWRLSAR